jgi:alpha-tubulin suppressor-like RCC1 family protein
VDPAVAGTDLLSPVPVHGAAANVTQLSGPNGNYKGRYVLSLRSDGTVWGWGRNYIGVLGDPTIGSSFAPVQIHGLPPGIVQVAAGGIHAAALAADGSVWTWGRNDHGQLGDGTHTDRTTPARWRPPRR